MFNLITTQNLIEKSHVTPIASGKPFHAACASNIQEKSHAVRDLSQATNRMRQIEQRIASSVASYV